MATTTNGTNGTHETATGQRPYAAHWTLAEPTKEDLEYADLPIIDLEEAKTNPEKVAEQVRTSMTTKGFLYIVNHGYTLEQMQRMYDISNVPFDQVPEEDQKKFDAKAHESGSWQGYKLRKYWELEGGVRDDIEMYSMNKDVKRREHPQALQPFLPEISAFAKHYYDDVVHPMMRLLARGMELPENTFVDMHNWDRVSESFVRFIKYHPHTEEEDEKSSGIWFQGHTDFGSITLLHSQPVAALQILADGKWKWVKHVENAIIMNAGDSLEFLSGGFYKATIHRVIKPPADQAKSTRLGCFFFTLVDDDVRLAPPKNCPVLERVGVTRRLGYADEDAPTMEQWRRSRTQKYGAETKKDGTESKTKFIGEAKVTEEVINGVVVKHYA